MQAKKHASEGSTLALKPTGDVIRSPKQGYQWPHKKDSCPPKIFLKKGSKPLMNVKAAAICLIIFFFMAQIAHHTTPYKLVSKQTRVLIAP